MFYVSGAKIYLATFDAELKVYPEVKLAWIDYDHLGVVKTGKGVTKNCIPWDRLEDFFEKNLH